MNILLLEDDQKLRLHMEKSFVGAGFAVSSTDTLSKAVELLDVHSFDALVLDLNLPDGDGFTLLKTIRSQKNQIPVIIVTARGDVDERVEGLNIGADDYVVKPIDTTELIARTRAVIRRSSQTALPEIAVGPLLVSPAKHAALLDGNMLDITAKEFSVLEYLAQHHGEVVTRTMIMEHVWGSDFDVFSNVIDVYIRNLRRKLEEHNKGKLIHTIRGKGYVLKYDK